MKSKTTICLSILILVCCLTPVISAEINDDDGRNSVDLNVNDTADLNNQNTLSKRYPKFHMFFVDNPDGIYSQYDDIRFEITFDPDFHGPLDIYLDKEYITTVCPDYGNVIIGFVNYHLPPGTHRIECEFKGDDNFFLEYCGASFYIK